jgi:hypothetical protein
MFLLYLTIKHAPFRRRYQQGATEKKRKDGNRKSEFQTEERESLAEKAKCSEIFILYSSSTS